ncbi:hypothetical protein GSI_09445 [Ganoderma sinense ZZ0214-1]|uniref:Secreted protein n=1 Tax=Ganoderma sinense ZZ0214-1 TaxID=1077348 RepID=A0A2G8S6J5_9APHY|nr:hypothetical protein GSI_09445 [Ganoderma sinense ZZ0214-1]
MRFCFLLFISDSTTHASLARCSWIDACLFSLSSRGPRPSVFIRRDEHVEHARVLSLVVQNQAICRPDDSREELDEFESARSSRERLLEGVSQWHEILDSRMR